MADIIQGLEFYTDSIKGPIKVIRSMARFNELLVTYKSNGEDVRIIWKLSDVINGFKNKLYRLNAIPGLNAIINEPAEIIIVRMALPALRDRIQANIDLLQVGTPDGVILLEAYSNYLTTIDGLIKRLNA